MRGYVSPGMNIDFYKMHGAGNDFILVDDREGRFPWRDRDWVARSAARRTGVGCDGVALIQRSDRADFRMRFLNPDGGEASMCGNGARCIARLAAELGAAPARMRIETEAGLLRAVVDGDSVRVWMTEPRGWSPNRELTWPDGAPVLGHVLDTGVPHFVTEVPDIEAVDVAGLGARIRRHPAFAPEGANANFIRIESRDRLRLRTYERGVEAETLACGTGMVACALAAARLGRVDLPVTVVPASGDRLEVDARLDDEAFREVTLTGPAVHVYRGVLVYAGDGGGTVISDQ